MGASYKYVGQCAYCMEEAFSHPRAGRGPRSGRGPLEYIGTLPGVVTPEECGVSSGVRACYQGSAVIDCHVGAVPLLAMTM